MLVVWTRVGAVGKQNGSRFFKSLLVGDTGSEKRLELETKVEQDEI